MTKTNEPAKTQLEESHCYMSSVNEQHDGLFTPSGGRLEAERRLIRVASLWEETGLWRH